MKGIILHGGHGTRLRPLTHTGPKQLLPIANKPMSEYCVETLVDAGIVDIAFIIGGTGSDKVKEYYGNGEKFGVKFTYIEQESISSKILSDLWIFSVTLIILYVPVSILIGYWHIHSQLNIENTIKLLENPLHAHLCRIILDSRTGRVSEKEIIELRTLLSKIENS